MRASQWTTNSGGMAKNLSLNPSAALPKNARNLSRDQTLVLVKYSSINPVDYKLAEMPILNSIAISKPATPSLDFAGIVVATSRSDLQPGQRVFGALEPPNFGALADYLVVGLNGCAPLPEAVSFEQAACVGIAGITAYQCLSAATSGDKVFINGGSGGTGTFGIQIAKAKGCYVVTSCSGPNVELCKSLGADEVLDYKTQDIVETLKRSGRQFDLIFDTVGSNFDLYWQSHHYLKPDAEVVFIAAAPNLFSIRNLMMVFLWPAFLGGGQRMFGFRTAKVNTTDYAHIARLMADEKVKAIVEETYNLDQAGKAYERLKTGRTRGKLLIKVSAD